MERCSLCDMRLPKCPILDGIDAFCCHGCHAVFNILSAKNQLENFEQQPVFIQALRSGLISNPALIEEFRARQTVLKGEHLEKLHLEIGEMWCPSCSEIIRLILIREPGVKNCLVDYATDLSAIEYAPKFISKEKIYALIKKLGYEANPLQITGKKVISMDLYLRFAIAAFCSLNLMMFAYPLYATYFSYDGEKVGTLFAWISFFICLPVIGYSGWPIFRRFYNGCKVGFLGMEALVVIGVAAAFILSCIELWLDSNRVYFDSMSVIITFVLLGKIIESKAKFSAKEAMLQLARSSPKKGRKRFPDGSSRFVLIKEIQKGDTLIAHMGEKIVLDGIVMEGEGACDESLMTGESIPVLKKKGSKLLGGSILTNGWMAYQATVTLEESALQKIIDLVEKDIGEKAGYTRAADHIIQWFVPFVFFLAAVTAIYYLAYGYGLQMAGLSAISILLISCPCAIGIAAPLAESHLMNGFAWLGAIVRNRGVIPLLGKETVWVFDKTGTVTEGSFKVISGLERLNSIERQILSTMATHSNHPVACGISRSVSESPIQCDSIEEIAGMGMKAWVGSTRYLIGSAQFLLKNGIAIPDVEGEMTQVYFACNETCLTCLHLGDTLRKGMEEFIQALKPAKTILLSGDGSKTVEAISKKCGFDQWFGECSPLKKRECIDNLRKQGEIVCMVGDGVNDAPSLTRAQIGISVFTATDMSIQVSDLLLTSESLDILLKVRALAQKGQRIVKQNLFWAFFYNGVGMGLAVWGLLSPIFAAFAMAVSSLIVLFNAKRLSKIT